MLTNKFKPATRKLILVILLMPSSAVIFSQNVETIVGDSKEQVKDFWEGIKKARPLEIKGSVNLSGQHYTVNGIAPRFEPFTYTYGGNIDLFVYGIHIPATFSFSNLVSRLGQQFNRFGASPYYRWIQLHGGYRMMDFSHYTFSGITFLGGGVALTPGKFHFSSFYGRLRKEVSGDVTSAGEAFFLPSFRRNGYGFKTGYDDGEKYANLIFLKVMDEEHSIVIPEDGSLLPQDNLVISLQAGGTIFKRLMVRGELANSILNSNTQAPEIDLDHYRFYNRLGFVFQPTGSAEINNAMNTSLSYSLGNYNIGATYERVDPGYRSLGTFFINNDLERYTIDFSGSLWRGKISFSGNIGQQNNNIEGNNADKIERGAISGNITLNPINSLNITSGYSNYTTLQEFLINPELDTLDFVQINNSYQASIAYGYPVGAWRHNISLNGNYQTDITEPEASGKPDEKSFIQNLTASYQLKYRPANLSIILAYNFNDADFGEVRTRRTGPSVRVSKLLLKKRLKIQVSHAFFNNQQEGSTINSIQNAQIAANYRPDKRHSFGINSTMVIRNHLSETIRGDTFTEVITSLKYNFRL